jgi:hypothetical protein
VFVRCFASGKGSYFEAIQKTEEVRDEGEMMIVFTVFDKFTIYSDFGSPLDYGN